MDLIRFGEAATPIEDLEVAACVAAASMEGVVFTEAVVEGMAAKYVFAF
jgi:hypothetical protein